MKIKMSNLNKKKLIISDRFFFVFALQGRSWPYLRLKTIYNNEKNYFYFGNGSGYGPSI